LRFLVGAPVRSGLSATPRQPHPPFDLSQRKRLGGRASSGGGRQGAEGKNDNNRRGRQRSEEASGTVFLIAVNRLLGMIALDAIGVRRPIIRVAWWAGLALYLLACLAAWVRGA
jgi:hypothetical protein